jgi:hypothetical protein
MTGGFTLDWYNGWSTGERLATIPAQREAIASGALPRPIRCSICAFSPREQPGTGNRVWLHNEDYGDPLAIYEICRICHAILHERFETPEPWLALVRRHGSGDRWFERLSMDPASRQRPFRETYPDALPRP